MLKWLGAGLIVAACGGCGLSMAQNCRAEERSLRQMLHALQIMQQELSCHCTPLPELFRLAAKALSNGLQKLMLAVADELEQQNMPDAATCMKTVLDCSTGLPESCRELLSDLGRSLGCFDLSGQMQQLESVAARCQQMLSDHMSGQRTRIRCYQSLGLCAGAALAILLL